MNTFNKLNQSNGLKATVSDKKGKRFMIADKEYKRKHVYKDEITFRNQLILAIIKQCPRNLSDAYSLGFRDDFVSFGKGYVSPYCDVLKNPILIGEGKRCGLLYYEMWSGHDKMPKCKVYLK